MTSFAVGPVLSWLSWLAADVRPFAGTTALTVKDSLVQGLRVARCVGRALPCYNRGNEAWRTDVLLVGSS
eukprot:COSAG02_NODE_7335_length_3059_cov_1.828716_5_plen_70_part_00